MPEPVNPSSRGRRYRSALRQRQATETRQHILDAARHLFERQGFTRSSIADIAASAQVSSPTVYAVFGSKAGLLGMLLTQMEDDADARAWQRRIREAEPPDRIAAFAAWSRSLYASGIGLIRAAYQANGDPGVAALHAEGDRRRRDALTAIVASLQDHRALRPGLGATRAVDQAFVLTSPTLYLNCVDGCGWTDDDYQQWLTALLESELLGP